MAKEQKIKTFNGIVHDLIEYHISSIILKSKYMSIFDLNEIENNIFSCIRNNNNLCFVQVTDKKSVEMHSKETIQALFHSVRSVLS